MKKIIYFMFPFSITIIKATKFEFNKTQCSYQHLKDEIYSTLFYEYDIAWNILIFHLFYQTRVIENENLSSEEPVVASSHQNFSSSKNCIIVILDRFKAMETPEIINQLNNTELIELDSKDMDAFFEKS